MVLVYGKRFVPVGVLDGHFYTLVPILNHEVNFVTKIGKQFVGDLGVHGDTLGQHFSPEPLHLIKLFQVEPVVNVSEVEHLQTALCNRQE